MAVSMPSAVTGVRRSILGRGCDPVRAAFAKKQWEPVLGVDIDTATSDQQLVQLLTSGKKYSVFFLAPGQCQLVKAGRVDWDLMQKTVKQHQPECKIVQVPDVAEGLSVLSEALGVDGVGDVKPLTEAWPFVD